MDENSRPEQVYFFRTFTDGAERHRREGVFFSSAQEAWDEASTSAGEIIREMNGRMHPGLNWQMDVTDAVGKVLYRLSFKTEKFE